MKKALYRLDNPLIDRIKLILTEEVNQTKDVSSFIEAASFRILELVGDEKVYGYRKR